jgi:hypothetical protein
MVKLIKIGGAERPLRFSTAAKAEFARHNDVSYGAVEGGFKFDMMSVCILTYYGLKHGVRRDRHAPALPKNFSWIHVADWIDDEPDRNIIEEVITIFGESLGVDIEAIEEDVESEVAEEKK